MSEITNRIGFLACTEFEGWGWCGGLLLLNQLARPLEFHCTLPVKVSRTQSILYGQGLRSHVCGQVIGKALVEKPKTPPHLIVTDCRHTAHVFRETTLPILYAPADIESDGLIDQPDVTRESPWQSLEVGPRPMWLAMSPSAQLNVSACDIQRSVTNFVTHHDLAEPLERVRQAIFEAREAASRAA